MSITTAPTFAERFAGIANIAANKSNNDAKADKPKAQFWLNIGYEQPFDEKYPFVSLSNGIAIDTMERHELRGNNQEYLTLLKKQNDLVDVIQAMAEQLEPGETTIVSRCEHSGLCMQLRRVGQAQEFTPETSTTPPIMLKRLDKAA